MMPTHRSRLARSPRTGSAGARLLARALALGAGLVALSAGPATAQVDLPEVGPVTAEGPGGSVLHFSLSNQFRAEFVDWWRSRTAPERPARYDFQGNRFKLGVSAAWRRLEVFVQLQHVFLNDVPRNGLGPGGVYWANTPETFQSAVMLRNGWARISDLGLGDHSSLTIGRQPYDSSQEAPFADPHLARLVIERLGGRLLGVREYSLVGRSFDGVRLIAGTERAELTLFGFTPTTGGFDIDGNKNIPEIATAGGALSYLPPPELAGTSLQAFYYFYHDDRDLVVFDNRPLARREADRGKALNLHTIGGQAVRTFEVGPGTADVLLWGAAQLGDWQSQFHRAWVWAFEAGFQWPEVFGAPWIRAGIDRGSGDGDPDDRYHETFFQLLPTARRRAKIPFYNLMNNQDLFAELWSSWGHGVRTQLSFHSLRVNSSRDFAYSGGGATTKTFFGYGGIPANGAHDLAFLLDVSARWQLNRNLAIAAYYGHGFGRAIVERSSPDRSLNYGFLELWITV